MRWDSPLVLALAGTAAVHLVVVTAVDAVVVTHPPRPWVPAPHIELVDIEVPPQVKPLPPPPPAAVPPPTAPVEPVKPAPRVHTARAVASPPRAAEPPPPPAPSEPAVPSGGEQVVHLDDVAPSATGVGVAVGKPVTGRVGRGGSGGGTGAGSGSGTSDEPPRPVSIATIKTRAMPRGDYGYFDAGRDYPAEARALGIEGAIRVKLTVDEHGKVTSRVLLTKLGHGLDELALKRAGEIEFDPALDSDNHPVTSVVVWTFNMTLPK
ncbi:MAG TPA: TonB family protein [Kofleriaceae bacterium]|nr:TonB family protein [Kofleriaceae bacterium]